MVNMLFTLFLLNLEVILPYLYNDVMSKDATIIFVFAMIIQSVFFFDMCANYYVIGFKNCYHGRKSIIFETLLQTVAIILILCDTIDDGNIDR